MSDTHSCFVMFHGPAYTLDDAERALQAEGLVVTRADTTLLVRWGESPTLRVSLWRGPDVLSESSEIGGSTPHETFLQTCDARLEIAFDDLDDVLDEMNTLIQTQGALQTATGGVFFNSWNGELWL